MSNLTITNNDLGGVVICDAVYNDDVVAFPGADTYAEGTILARQNISETTTVTADGGNTGNGTASAFTIGADAEVGDYTITCVTASDVPTTGAAAGSAAAFAGNTGNGTFGDIAVAADAIVGDYKLVIIEPAADAGVFEVTDPNGVVVGTGNVAVEFVGGGLTFTLADGATDFVAGDGFSITVAATGAGGVWEVFTPSGVRLDDLAVGTAYSSDHINGTISDGATDFVVGDAFTVTVAAGSEYLVIFDVDGVGGAQIPSAVLTYEITQTGAANVAARPLVSGRVRREKLVIDAGDTVTDSIVDMLRDYGIIAQSVSELNELDNQ